MFFSRLMGRIFSKILADSVAQEIRRTAAQVRRLELELAQDLAVRIHVPSEAVVFSKLPVPRVELKVEVSPEQLAEVDKFLDLLRDGPPVNAVVREGVH
jgi:hypothetical protein